MDIKKRLYLGKWDNWGANDPEREAELQTVIKAVEEFGCVSVSFDYDGRTRHQIASEEMASRLPKNYKSKIGYNYEFVIEKG